MHSVCLTLILFTDDSNSLPLANTPVHMPVHFSPWSRPTLPPVATLWTALVLPLCAKDMPESMEYKNLPARLPGFMPWCMWVRVAFCNFYISALASLLKIRDARHCIWFGLDWFWPWFLLALHALNGLFKARPINRAGPSKIHKWSAVAVARP